MRQGIVSCGRCARRICPRDSGLKGDYPVYVCVADRSAEGRPKCQEARALAVDAEVERLILGALTPDRIALAVAALGAIEAQSRTMERQWTLKRERARDHAERARRRMTPLSRRTVWRVPWSVSGKSGYGAPIN